MIEEHVEVFTPEDVTSFLSNGKKDANTDAEKKFIKVTVEKTNKAYPRLPRSNKRAYLFRISKQSQGSRY